MKKLILAIGFLLVAGNANAMLVDVFATGNMRERIDMCGYGCGYTSNNPSPGIVNSLGLMWAGGPVANNSVGYANQFSVSEETKIDYLLASAHIWGGDRFSYDPITQTISPELSSNTMYFKLYTGTLNNYHDDPSGPYPDSGTAALISSLFVTTHWEDVYSEELDEWRQEEKQAYYTDTPVPFDITLAPGTYWIAQERYAEDSGGLYGEPGWGQGSGSQVGPVSVKFWQNDLAVQHTPEPSTFLLFGLGLLGAFVRRRKRG